VERLAPDYLSSLAAGEGRSGAATAPITNEGSQSMYGKAFFWYEKVKQLSL